MKIYMDVCCLNRPFDDLSQDRVYHEAEAILSIISRCEKGIWTLIASGVIEYELSNTTNEDRLEQVKSLYVSATERIALTEQAEKRAAYFQDNGIKTLDSLHLAAAEISNADVFLTTDDRFLRKAKLLDLQITAANPLSWLMEVMKDER